jgi:ATP-dependent Clp protease ATP-binding subunit ClpA
VFERFTDRAKRVVVLAQEEARMLMHNYIGTEHLLLGLISEGEGVAAKALGSMNISLRVVRFQVEEIIGRGESVQSGHIPFTPRAKKVLELSLREALQLGHDYIGTEHILLGLIREGEGVAAQVLQQLGADLNLVRQQVLQLLSGYTGGRSIEEPVTGSVFLSALSAEAHRMLELAADAARDLGHDLIEPSDILIGLIVGADANVADALGIWGIDIEAVRNRIEELGAAEGEEDSE